MENNRNFFITIALSVLILTLWQVFYMNPKIEAERETARIEQERIAAEQKAAAPQNPGRPGTAGDTPAPPAGAVPGAPGGLPRLPRAARRRSPPASASRSTRRACRARST